MSEALQVLPTAEKIIQDRRAKFKSALADLKNAIPLLSYLPVLKVKTCNFSLLNEYLWDEELAETIDIISDRMLLNQYAAEFYDYWITLRKFQRHVLHELLFGIADLNVVKHRMHASTLEKLCGYTGVEPQSVISAMSPVYNRSQESDEFLCDLAKSVRTFDYYNFCKLIKDRPYDLKCDPVAALAIENAAKFAKDIKVSRLEYKLKDFTKEEISDCEEFKKLKLGRYVVKRLAGESPSDFCKRQVDFEENSIWYDNYDESKEFEGINVMVLSVCDVIQSAGYQSRMQTLFVSGMFKISAEFANLDGACNLMGISEEHLNFLQRDKYAKFWLEDAENLYKLLNGIYFSSVEKAISGLRQIYDETVVSVSDDLSSSCDEVSFKTSLEELDMAEYYETDDEGMPYNDKDDAELEIASCLGVNDYRVFLEG